MCSDQKKGRKGSRNGSRGGDPKLNCIFSTLPLFDRNSTMTETATGEIALNLILNSIESTVQFTKETESDGVLAFLDVKLTRENTVYLVYTVYRKPTHTNRNLNFRSDHPLQHEKTVIKTLLCRAKFLTSSEASYKEEINRIQLALKNSGYPPALTTQKCESTVRLVWVRSGLWEGELSEKESCKSALHESKFH